MPFEVNCFDVPSQVHKALRESYGETYQEGDVIGCWIYIPPGGRTLEPEKTVSWDESSLNITWVINNYSHRFKP